jgi:hypothetical protein
MGTVMEPKRRSPWVIVGIVVGILLLLLLCCFVAFFVLPVLFGPAIEKVFEDVVRELATPVP